MNGLEITIWSLLSLLGFVGTALCAGAETGSYTLNKVRLHILNQRNLRRAKLLNNLVKNPPAMLSSLLIGENAMSYLATASLAVILEAQHLSATQAIIINLAIATPIIFLLSEVLPKDLFAIHADRFMYPLALPLTLLRWLFTATGLIPLINLTTSLLMRAMGGSGKAYIPAPRRQIAALMKEGAGYGILSDEQTALAQRVLDLSSRTIGDEMISWDKVITIKLSSPAHELWTLADRTSHSRFPVIGKNSAQIMGVIDITWLLTQKQEELAPITDLMTKAIFMPANTPVSQALSDMQKNKLQLLIVTDSRDKPVGIVTIKDLVEAITGELTAW